ARLRSPESRASFGAAGSIVSDEPARHVDILPTILDTLQIAAPAGLPGHSLRTDAERRGGADRPSYFEAMTGMVQFGWAPLTGVVSGRDKYIALPISELYDLAADPHEATNLVVRAPARQRALAARLTAFHPVLPGVARSEDPDIA